MKYQNLSQQGRSSPLPDYTYPSHKDEFSAPLSFFAFVAYICLAVMHVLQFTVLEHFKGFYKDAALQKLNTPLLLCSLLWVVGTLLSLMPILVLIVTHLKDKDQRKSTTRLLAVLHICGIIFSVTADFLIGGVPTAIPLARWGFIIVLFFLAHHSKAKIYDLKDNLHTALFTCMILFTVSFVFLSLI